MADETRDLLKQVSNELVRVSDEFTKKADEAMREVRAAGNLSTETKAAVDQLATAQTTLTGMVDDLKARLGEVEQKNARRGGGGAEPRKSVGAQLVEAEGVKSFAASVQGGRRVSVPVKNATLSTNIPEGVVEPQRLPGIDVMPKQRLFIRDLIAPGRTTSPAIFWVQQTGFTNAAKIVPEGTPKPYSDIQFDTKITPVATIAHMFKASKQILDDFAQLQSTVDAEMRYGLKYVEEQEILFGSGASGHLHGIVPQASAFSPAFAPTARTEIDDLRLAILQAQLARLPVDGFVVHFTDWAKMELTKDDSGQYILANPLRLAGPTLWGLPVVATEAPEFEGEFLAGAFQTGAQLFDREDANVVISTENVDDFEKNMVSIRCEERLALAVKRPEAFVTGAFGAAVAAG
ncbi:HK97 family phage major capsid protein [Methylobacterium sp. PvP062]|uniref:HK97 family phage major capsid protein n=1 Tax=Methylobacterium radiotolerans TaxID=31998 RepID=A0ABV2NNB8_9HYPH|nr:MULTISPECIES: phage major capsid protein [unclassified Methylobacterium]MBP2495389.1 HK97 family phage major capsid protein [Methylobacterium sp. PvP105]MBP2504740.1 HK97 family phage major capsid protein [Methylobacterium sp. PvP109]MCX7335750.1 phage major capsid protein [Hyphomicrobiales bacterium]